MPFAGVNDIQMYYEAHGDGEPLVLMEGLGSDHKGLLELQVPVYDDHFQCIVLDNRGVGRTDKPDIEYSTPMMADDVVALLDHLEIAQAHFAGWSMGGAIAQQIGIRHPKRVLSLLLHCTWPRTDRYLAWQLELRRPVLERLGREELYRNVLLTAFTPEFFEQRPDRLEEVLREMVDNPDPQPQYAYFRQMDACLRHDAADGLPSVTAPTLITVGAGDRLTARFADQLKELLPHADLRIIEGAAHALFEERPEAFNAICLEFLTERARVEA